MEKLRPCPFCGGRARVEQESALCRHVRCTQCWARTAPLMLPDENPEALSIKQLFYQIDQKAIELWNRRAA